MKKVRNEKGQALIEFIIFLPLLITLYSVIGGYASAINGSINQLKITRAYFYSRVQNNSNIPGPTVSNQYKSWGSFGMYFIGWKDYFQNGEYPIMPCYKVNIPFKGNAPQDKCEEPYGNSSGVPKSLFVRVGTVYGICGATYTNRNGNTFVQDGPSVDQRSCLISR